MLSSPAVGTGAALKTTVSPGCTPIWVPPRMLPCVATPVRDSWALTVVEAELEGARATAVATAIPTPRAPAIHRRPNRRGASVCVPGMDFSPVFACFPVSHPADTGFTTDAQLTSASSLGYAGRKGQSEPLPTVVGMPVIGAHVHSDDPLVAAKTAGAEAVQIFLSDP